MDILLIFSRQGGSTCFHGSTCFKFKPKMAATKLCFFEYMRFENQYQVNVFSAGSCENQAKRAWANLSWFFVCFRCCYEWVFHCWLTFDKTFVAWDWTSPFFVDKILIKVKTTRWGVQKICKIFRKMSNWLTRFDSSRLMSNNVIYINFQCDGLLLLRTIVLYALCAENKNKIWSKYEQF